MKRWESSCWPSLRRRKQNLQNEQVWQLFPFHLHCRSSGRIPIATMQDLGLERLLSLSQLFTLPLHKRLLYQIDKPGGWLRPKKPTGWCCSHGTHGSLERNCPARSKKQVDEWGWKSHLQQLLLRVTPPKPSCFKLINNLGRNPPPAAAPTVYSPSSQTALQDR